MDKDRFRQDLGNVMEAYEEVLSRLRTRLEPLPPSHGSRSSAGPHFHFTTLLSDMTLHFEVISRFQAAANADALLYTP